MFKDKSSHATTLISLIKKHLYFPLPILSIQQLIVSKNETHPKKKDLGPKQGLNIVDIQRLMGHADIRTTMRYIFVSVEQKNKALATLKSTSTLKLKKKWKKLPKGQSLLEYVGLKK